MNKISVIIEAVVWHSNHAVNTFFHISLHASVHAKVSKVWLEASSFSFAFDAWPYWNSFWLTCCCPSLQKVWSFGSGLGSSPAPADYSWGRCWLGRANTRAWFWAWAAKTLLSSPALPCLHHPGILSSMALAISPLAVMVEGLGQFCFHGIRVSSPTPTPTWPALLCCSGTV